LKNRRDCSSKKKAGFIWWINHTDGKFIVSSGDGCIKQGPWLMAWLTRILSTYSISTVIKVYMKRNSSTYSEFPINHPVRLSMSALIQQCFSLTINQHQPESASQKLFSEQGELRLPWFTHQEQIRLPQPSHIYQCLYSSAFRS
jgi:hypothetical protein